MTQKTPYPLSNRPQRYAILFFTCLFTFGSYFCYDTPGALVSQLERGSLHLTFTEFNLLYSVYSWPNIILVFLGGFLIDRLGSRVSSVALSLITFIGQIITALGVYRESFYLLLVGRFLFGTGSESLNVCQSTIVSHWFQGSELAMAFGFSLTVSRLGSIIAFNILPSFSQRFGLYVAFVLGATLCSLSFLATLCFVYIDRKAESKLVLENDINVDIPDLQGSKSLSISLPLNFWLGSIVGMTAYSIFFSFIAVGSDLMQLDFELSASTSGFFVSLIYNISMFLAPLFGKLLDIYGLRGWVVWISVILTTLSLYIFRSLLSRVKQLSSIAILHLVSTSTVLLGLGLSGVSSALWPTLATCVKPSKLATAIGVAQALQNFGTSLTTFGMGIIVDRAGYDQGLKLLLFLGVVSSCFAFIWNIHDKLGEQKINSPSEAYMEIEELEQPLADENRRAWKGKLLVVPVTPRAVILVRQRLLGVKGQGGVVRQNYYSKIGINYS
eukprot:jgi/Galph1/2908/GphlegSOOS_G1556.1